MRTAARQRLLLPALVLTTTVTAVVSSLGAPLVPEIAAERDVPLSAAQWTLTAAVLAGAVATPLVGRLGGFRHRRKVLLAGMVVVLAGLLVTALPLGFPALVLGRAMQGVGLGLAPLAIAVARDALPLVRVPAAIALLSVSNVAGAGLGYPLTAFVADRFGLAAAYWLGFAVCALTLALVATVVPHSSVVDDAPVDWWGAGLLAAGSGGLLLTLSQGGAWGFGSTRTWGLSAGAVTVLALWARHSLRSSRPLVDLRLAGRRGVVGANLTAVCAGAGMYLLLSLVMVLSQAPESTGYGLGMSITEAGALLVPYSLSSVLGNRMTLRRGARFRPDLLLPGGACIYLISTLGLTLWHDQPWQLFVVMAVAGLGSGCTFAAMPGLIVRFVPLEETGSAMAFNQVLRYLGFSTGSALAPAVLHLFAGGPAPTAAAFTWAFALASGIWALTALGTLVLALRGPGPSPDPAAARNPQLSGSP